MRQTDPHFKLRLPPALKARIEEAAKADGRSMSAEIVNRLEGSYQSVDQSSAFAERIDSLMRSFADQSALMRLSIATANSTILHIVNHLLEKDIELPLMNKEYLQRLRKSVAHGQQFDAIKSDLAIFQRTISQTNAEVPPAIYRVFEAYGLVKPATDDVSEEQVTQPATPGMDYASTVENKTELSQRKRRIDI